MDNASNVPAPPPVPKGAFRITLTVRAGGVRLDKVLLDALRAQKESIALRNISRMEFKALFEKKRIKIKGQNARASSTLATGVTYVDILGHGSEEA